jgi:GH15 family glucan-1,4-alpha-glucosidase
LKDGQSAAFVFEEFRGGGTSESENPRYASTAFKDTLNYWRRWIRRCKYQGRWREMMHRSASVLKLLTSHPDGSLQIMYGIDGRHNLPEETLHHLEGYRGSSPIRIGNGRMKECGKSEEVARSSSTPG